MSESDLQTPAIDVYNGAPRETDFENTLRLGNMSPVVSKGVIIAKRTMLRIMEDAHAVSVTDGDGENAARKEYQSRINDNVLYLELVIQALVQSCINSLGNDWELLTLMDDLGVDDRSALGDRFLNNTTPVVTVVAESIRALRKVDTLKNFSGVGAIIESMSAQETRLHGEITRVSAAASSVFKNPLPVSRDPLSQEPAETVL